MSSKIRLVGGVLGSSIALALTFGETARAEDAADAAAYSDGTVLEEIIVTAQKRSENLQKVPISAAVLSGQDLTQENKSTLDEILRHVPGLELQENSGGYIPTIRGVTNNAGASAATSIYIDQVYSSQEPFENRAAFVDINRVEVLRGPQGTLWGGNALGGTISVVTNEPELGHYLASATVGTGNYDSLSGQAIVNVPVSDQLAVRAVLASEDRRGYYANGQDDSVYTAGRLKVLYQPTDDLKMVLTLMQTKIGGEGVGSILSPYPASFTSLSNPWGNPAPLTLNGASITPVSPAKVNSYRGNVEWNLGFGTLTLLPATTVVDQKLVASTGNGLVNSHIHHNRTSGELRLNSNADSTITWTIGGYYQHFNTPLDIYISNPGIALGNSYLKDTNTAGFGQVTVPVTSTTRVTGGIRRSKESFHELDYWSDPALSALIPLVPLTVYHPGSADFEGTTWKAGVEQDIAKDSMLYANVSTGWRPGGLLSNSLAGPPAPIGNSPDQAPLGAYAPERLTAFTLGTKNKFLNDSLAVNAEAFYYKYYNYEVLTASLTGVSYEALAQGVHSFGGELESRWRVTSADTLDASAAYLHSTFGTQTGGAGSTADSTSAVYVTNGSDTDHAPRWTAHAGYERRLFTWAGSTLSGEVDGDYVTAQNVYFSTNCHALGVPCVQGAHSIFNGRLMWNTADGRWNATAYVRNISNYPVFNNAVPGTAATATSAGTPETDNLAPPRTFGLTLTVKLDVTR